MLTLARKRGQRILVGDDVVLTVLGTSRGNAVVSVRVGGDLRSLPMTVGQQVDLAPETFFVLLGVKPNKAMIGISAPADVLILREELKGRDPRASSRQG